MGYVDNRLEQSITSVQDLNRIVDIQLERLFGQENTDGPNKCEGPEDKHAVVHRMERRLADLNYSINTLREKILKLGDIG